jgi:hypothetical protein
MRKGAMMERCKRCGDFRLFDSDKCPCKSFRVRIPDWWGDEEEVQYAQDKSDAAEKAVERSDEDHNSLNGPIVVFVDDVQFEVEAEAVVQYHAYTVSDECVSDDDEST